MKPLKRSDGQRFGELCEKIRIALHLNHLDWEYRRDEEETCTIASTHVFSSGWRLLIYIRPPFWRYSSYEKQVRALIHEHIHVCLHPYHQAIDQIEREWVSPHCKSQVNEMQHQAGEIAVDHLESVLYDLLKESLL